MIKIHNIACAKSDSAFKTSYLRLGIMATAALLSVQASCNKVDLGNMSPQSRTIVFGENGGSEQFRTSGWSKTETEYTWTEGKTATLALPIPANLGAITLTMKLDALVSSNMPSQTVEVIANGQTIANWQVADTADFTARIPSELTQNGGTLTLELRTPNATSPKALGLGDDSRILGIRVYSMDFKRS